MEKTTCPITGVKTNRGLNFSTDYYVYNLTNLFVSYEIFRDMLEDNTKIDIEEKTKLAGKLANFSMDYALKNKITYSKVNADNYPAYDQLINKKFLENLEQEPISTIEKKKLLFLDFLINTIKKVIPDYKNISEKTYIYRMQEQEYLNNLLAAISYAKKRDVELFIEHFQQRGLLDSNGNNHYRVTLEGREFLEEKRKNQESKKVFVAMWFNEKVDFIYEQAVEPAIRECNYEPERIDRVEHNNIIDDEIIANIKQSKFIIADFTAEKDKPRGGVYYEAGFADGFGIPVIFTCRKDLIENKEIHFDLEHRNFIWWEKDKMEDFKKKLINRIKATID